VQRLRNGRTVSPAPFKGLEWTLVN